MEERPIHDPQSDALDIEVLADVVAVEEEELVPTPLDPATKDEVDRLLSLAHFAATKGATAVAQKHLDEAVALAPNSPDVLVAVGDSLMERRQLARAHEAYAKATKLDKSHIVAERKFGETLLQLKAVEFAFLGGSDYVSPASGKSAMMLSVFVPGLGQYVLGEERKGVTFFLVWLVALLSGQLFGGGLGSLMGMFGGNTPFNPVALICAVIAFLTHAGAIGDAASSSKKMDIKKIDRPAPPVDKPFEL